MATKLPSSSEPAPDGAAAGCDTSDLIQVHKILRWLFAELPGLIETVPAGDLERSATIADHVSMVAFAVHLHHESEDAVLWDRIEARAPSCAAHVDQMRAQHAEIADQLATIEPLVPGWRASADPTEAAVIIERFGRLRETFFGHLGDEETEIVPVAGRVLSQAEWGELEEHARANLPRDMIPLQLGLMLASIPPDERDQWSKENLPASIRLLYTLVLKRKYERHMLTLYPDGAVPSMT